MSRHRVAVLGAGVAGATVARGLVAAGVKDVVIVEGGGAVGGRLRQVPLGDVDVEIGANWCDSGVVLSRAKLGEWVGVGV